MSQARYRQNFPLQRRIPRAWVGSETGSDHWTTPILILDSLFFRCTCWKVLWGFMETWPMSLSRPGSLRVASRKISFLETSTTRPGKLLGGAGKDWDVWVFGEMECWLLSVTWQCGVLLCSHLHCEISIWLWKMEHTNFQDQTVKLQRLRIILLKVQSLWI